MQGITATTRHEVTTKISTKRLKHTEKFQKEPTVKRCLLF